MRLEHLDTDVLVIGGGAAGCSAALRAQALGAKVLMVVKGKMGRSGATPLASALGAPPPRLLPLPVLKAATAVVSKLATAGRVPLPARYEAIIRKMIAPHYSLVDQEYFVRSAMWLLEHFFPELEWKGLYVVRDETGKPAVPQSSNHTYLLQSHGMTGYQFGEARRKEVLASPVAVMEEAMVFDLLRGERGAITGGMVMDYKGGRLLAVRAKATILATGHTNWLSTRSTGTREMAANGFAMAARAGAELQNLEIQWFHGSDMAWPPSWMRLHHYPNPLTGSSRRAVMVNRDGEEYMRIENYDISMPYTIQMKHLYEQVRKGKADWDRGSFADFSRVEPDLLKKYQYHWEFYEKLGKDAARDRFESGITWHMSAGGVRVNVETMETGVPGLFVAGAVGAHMLGGLPHSTYDGLIAAASAVRYAAAHPKPAPDSAQVRRQEDRVGALLAGAGKGGGISPIEAKTRVRAIVWDNLMFQKNGQTLRRALVELDEARRDLLPKLRLRTATSRYNVDLMDALDLEDMIDVSEMSARASLAREESRGPHFREDFPYTDNENWLKWVVVSRKGGKVDIRTEPVPQKYVAPKQKRVDYLADPYA